MKRDFLEALGLEKETVDKILDENMRDTGRELRKAEQAQEELSQVKEQLDEKTKALGTLQKSSGDVGKVQKQLEDLQKKYDTDVQSLNDQLAERDYNDAVTKAISSKGIKFSSKAAEKAYIADLKEKHLPLKDGALDGFEDFHKAQVEADPTAFQGDKPAPTFTKPIGNGGAPDKGKSLAKKLSDEYYENLYGKAKE